VTLKYDLLTTKPEAFASVPNYSNDTSLEKIRLKLFKLSNVWDTSTDEWTHEQFRMHAQVHGQMHQPARNIILTAEQSTRRMPTAAISGIKRAMSLHCMQQIHALMPSRAGVVPPP